MEIELIKKVKAQGDENNNIIKTVNLPEIDLKNFFWYCYKAILPEVKVNEYNESVIEKVFNYFTGNKEFCEKNNISLKKSIYLVGGVGTGKSILFRAIKHFTMLLGKNSYKYYNSIDIINSIAINGAEELEKFGHNFNGISYKPITCYIDDIGSCNEKVKHYGTDISVIENIITLRYNVFQQFGKLTHFSSNIYPEDIATIYDVRILDRLTEMCNVIELAGESYRN